MRTTQSQIDARFRLVRERAIELGIIGAERWELDHASAYGGWTIAAPEATGGVSYLGGGFMDANRMAAGDFYRALRLLGDVLELVYIGRGSL